MYNNRKVVNRSGTNKGRAPLWVNGLESTEIPYDARAYAVFQLDTLIFEQYHNIFKRKLPLAPEKSLMVAVLQDAVTIFQNNLGARNLKKRELFLETEEWILDRDRRYFYSFENVCESLGFDPGYLRRGLMRWKAAALATRSVPLFAKRGKSHWETVERVGGRALTRLTGSQKACERHPDRQAKGDASLASSEGSRASPRSSGPVHGELVEA